MKNDYGLYGEVVGFEEFGEVVECEQKWHSFFVSGCDQRGRNRIFAVCLAVDNSSESMTKCL